MGDVFRRRAAAEKPGPLGIGEHGEQPFILGIPGGDAFFPS